jgi:hypothetical protein
MSSPIRKETFDVYKGIRVYLYELPYEDPNGDDEYDLNKIVETEEEICDAIINWIINEKIFYEHKRNLEAYLMYNCCLDIQDCEYIIINGSSKITACYYNNMLTNEKIIKK